MLYGARICGDFLAALDGRTLPVTLHSRFRGAANLATPLGLFTLLVPNKCIQPYSVVLSENMDFSLLEAGSLLFGPVGLHRNGYLLIALQGALTVDLKQKPGAVPELRMAYAVQRFLASGPGEGLSCLALGRWDSPYASLVAPRLQALRRAVLDGDPIAATITARHMAGCGPGLTPSSDDLICGYLALLPTHGPWVGMAAQIAAAAAGGTNDISAALLTRAGEGSFSEDVLALLACLRQGVEGMPLMAALLRVAGFGSSSGYDFLTGVYFGILDDCAIGGICT